MKNAAIPNTIEVIEKLRRNSHLNKHIHFNASKRDRNYHVGVGIPVVIISVLLSFFLAVSGSNNPVVFSDIKNTNAEYSSNIKQDSSQNIVNKWVIPVWAKWVGVVLALLVAALGGIQTFFNFQKEYEGNRKIGNQYLSIARESERLISLYFDELISLSELAGKLELLNAKYADTNEQAEYLNVTDKDFRRAKIFQMEKSKYKPSLVQRMRAKQSCEDIM